MTKSEIKNTKKERKEAAERKLREMGAELLKKEDRFGETKTGWWMDETWLAPTNDPEHAIEALGRDE